MKKFKVILITFGGMIILYFGLLAFRSISVEDSLTVVTTDHFVISYQGIYKAEAQDIADKLEDDYERIRTSLNDPQHDTIRVFVHPTQSDFNKRTGLLNSRANGTSRGPKEFHLLYTTWFNTIFPNDPLKTALHEFTHCVQLNILIKEFKKEFSNDNNEQFDQLFEQKFANDYPQWFWEAVCDYEAGIVNTMSVKYGMRQHLSVKELNNSDQIYNVGYTIIEYIVEKWGEDKLPLLITSYVDIKTVLGVSESDFEKGWVEYVDEKY